MDTPNQARGRGRPIKDADLNYPRRKATQELIERLRGENDTEIQGSQGDSGYDQRDIFVNSAEAKREQKPPAPSDQQAEEIEEINSEDFEPNESYHCNACHFPLLGGERHCAGCGERLDWSGIR